MVYYPHQCRSPGDKDKDYVSTVDWSDGGVRDNVMAGLMDALERECSLEGKRV